MTISIIKEGYKLSEKELRHVQLIELEMLVEVDRICKKNKILYCISAGTQLGATRHAGFIPWDDDADVAFLREEYIKFREACITDLDHDRFYFQDQETTPGYRWGYGKLRRKDTKFIRLNQEFMPYEQGIFIDIMPYDFVPDNYIARKLHALKSYMYRKFFWAAVGKYSTVGIEKHIYTILDMVPDKYLFNSYRKFVNRCNRRKTSRVRILTLPVPGNQHGYETRCLEKTTTVMFEGIELMGMKHFDDYLSYKYGDYNQLPDEKDRKVHPVSSLQLFSTLSESVFSDLANESPRFSHRR